MSFYLGRVRGGDEQLMTSSTFPFIRLENETQFGSRQSSAGSRSTWLIVNLSYFLFLTIKFSTVNL
jgi:hypothetical protein